MGFLRYRDPSTSANGLFLHCMGMDRLGKSKGSERTERVQASVEKGL